MRGIMSGLEKHAGGRPSKYTPELLENVRDYIENYEAKGDAVPSVAGLSDELNIARSTLYEWAKEHAEFSDMLDGILSKQERKLLNKSLKGEFNSTISKLMLAKHGYVEKSEVDQHVKGDIVWMNDVPRPKRDEIDE